MSAPINDGGPAYPVPPARIEDVGGHDREWVRPKRGMSLRDRLAIAAMQGDAWALVPNDATHKHLLARARLYYRAADAVLEARGGGE